MAEPKRTTFQRENDLVILAGLYLRGVPQVQMAGIISEQREYSISRQQVSYDLKTLTRRWLESEIVDLNEAKTQELAKINHLEQTYWEAWEDSRKTKEVTSTKRTIDDYGTKDEAGIRKEQQAGNPAYLAGVMTCINKRCDIFGLDAPKKVDLTWKEKLEEAGVDAGAAFEQLVNAIATARRSGHESDDARCVEGSGAADE